MRDVASLTIVVPFFNEEAVILAFHDALSKTLDLLSIPYDMIFVDDGSHDRTLEILNRLANSDDRMTVLSLSRNFGHQAALTAGLDHAIGDVIITMDGDLQHPPELIAEMVARYRAGAEIVFAVRSESKNLSLLKRANAFWYYTLLERVGNVRVIPGSADFRLLSRPALLALRTMREYHRYLRGMTSWLGFTTDIVYYQQPDRFAGRPTYTFLKSLRLAKAGLFSFSTVALDLITWLGVGLTALAFLYFIFILVVAFSGMAIPGWASVLASLLIIGGVQLISIGIIAQYIGMIFEEVKDRPLYIIKQKRLSSFMQTNSTTKESEIHEQS